MQQQASEARGTSPMRRLRTLARAGPRRQVLVIEAILRLAVARVAVATLPFRRVARPLGAFVSPGDPRITDAARAATAGDAALARDVGWAVQAAARWMPFRAVCLQQALAAHAMLLARGVVATMHLGTGTGDDTGMSAHAWLDAAGVKVTGYPIASHLTEIGCFV